jgi:hypothetical protein
MINYKFNQDIFESTADFIIIPVNTIGVMGAGLALSFKTRFPKRFQLYKELCYSGELDICKPALVYRDDNRIIGEPSHNGFVLFPTKKHYKDSSKIEVIAGNLEYMRNNLTLPLFSAWPKVGCGLGKLNWDNVLPLMLSYFNLYDKVDYEIYI